MVESGAGVAPSGRTPSGRWVLRIAVSVVLALMLAVAAVPAYFIVRGTYFPPTFDVVSIRTMKHYQDAALMERAWNLPVARTFRKAFTSQSNGSVCGPSSLANVSTSLGAP